MLQSHPIVVQRTPKPTYASRDDCYMEFEVTNSSGDIVSTVGLIARDVKVVHVHLGCCSSTAVDPFTQPRMSQLILTLATFLERTQS